MCEFFLPMKTNSWSSHHHLLNSQSLPPAQTLSFCLDYIAEQGRLLESQNQLAIDLGCGNGIDTLALLLTGWNVLSIDKEVTALNMLKNKTSSLTLDTTLQTECIAFEEITQLPTCRILNATFSLPFCKPYAFDHFWSICTAAIQEEGFFSGHFFGIRDTWKINPNMTFHSYAQVMRLFDKFTILDFEEVDKTGKTLSGQEKHWHVFHIVAQKN